MNLAFPTFIDWDITQRCNLNCIHCSASSTQSNKYRELPTKTVKRFIRDLSANGLFQISISGGEPFIRNDFLEILSTIISNDICAYTSTNGTLITRNTAKQLADIGMEEIQVSIDGATKNTHEHIRGRGTYEKALFAVRLLKKAGLRVIVSFALMRCNLNEVEGMINLSKRQGADVLKINTIYPAGKAKPSFSEMDIGEEDIQNVRKTLAEYPGDSLRIVSPTGFSDFVSGDVTCKAGISNLYISTEGDVYPCELLKEPFFYCGNITQSTLKDIWQSSTVLKTLRAAQNEGPSSCASCSLFKVCKGGCRARAYFQFGRLMPDPRCGYCI